MSGITLSMINMTRKITLGLGQGYKEQNHFKCKKPLCHKCAKYNANTN